MVPKAGYLPRCSAQSIARVSPNWALVPFIQGEPGPFLLRAVLAERESMKTRCDNCKKVWEGPIPAVRDLLVRVEPGSMMPAGECPECSALCYPEPDPKEAKRKEAQGNISFLEIVLRGSLDARKRAETVTDLAYWRGYLQRIQDEDEDQE